MKKLLFLICSFLPLFLVAQAPALVAERPLYESKSIGEIRISIPAKNWTDVLDSLRIYGDKMAEARVVIDGKSYSNCGVRYRGDKSYQTGIKRNPFSIKLNYQDKSQNHQGYTSLKISSALRDPSMVREMLFYEIAAKYMPAPQTSYTKLFVNDEYIGIFVNIESIDSQFLNKNYGSADRPFFKAGVDYKPDVPTSCKQNLNGSLEFEENQACYAGNFEMNSETGWAELQEMTRTLNFDVKSIEKMLDVDQTLWMLALNNVMVNLNSYTGTATNYYLYQDKFGQFRPVHWDLNLGFGGFKNTGSGSDLDLKDLQKLDPLLHTDNPYRPLISKLLEDELYRKIYLAHIRQIVRDNFKNGAYEKRAQELQAMIVVPFVDDKYKSYSLTDFQNNISKTVGRRSKIPGITELMSVRTKFLSEHPDLTSLPSLVSDLAQQSRAKFEKKNLRGFRMTAKADRFPKRMWIYYRFSDSEQYKVMPMEEDQAKALAAGERKFAATIEASSDDAVLQYYIMVENAGAVAFYPENYSVKPLSSSLKELNK